MNIFIVEDSAIMLKNLQSILPDIPGVAVIGHAVDESSAIEHINALYPDIVILDIRLQSGSGLGVLENIKKHHAWIKVVILTNCTEKAYINRCKGAGADYFFDKSLQFRQFHDALRELAHPDRFDNKLNALPTSGESPVASRSIIPAIENS